MVTWTRPKDQWIKVNTDGSATNNPGKIGAGGILRNKNGRLVMAFTTPLGDGTNNRAEIEATIFGLTWAIELGYRNIVLELDSQLVVHWILKKVSPQWSIITQLEGYETSFLKSRISSAFMYSGKLIGWRMHFQNTVTRHLLHKFTSTSNKCLKKQDHTITLICCRCLVSEG